jgi:hypothetical protein
LEHGAALFYPFVCAERHRKGAKHKHHRAPGCGLGQNVRRASRAESRLAASSSKSARKVGGFAALQQHHDDQYQAVQNKERPQNPRSSRWEAKTQANNPGANRYGDGPLHPTRHFYLLTLGKNLSLHFLRIAGCAQVHSRLCFCGL